MSEFNPSAVLADPEAETAKAAKPAKLADPVSSFSGISGEPRPRLSQHGGCDRCRASRAAGYKVLACSCGWTRRR